MISDKNDSTRSRTLIHHWQECKMVGTLENSLVVFEKLNICLLYSPAILLLGIYPGEMRTYIHTKTTTTQLFIASAFIVALNWK